MELREMMLAAAAAAALLATPSHAQRLGKGGTGVDENSELPQCAQPLGTVALVEDRSVAGVEEQLPPGMRALVQLAERQNVGSTARVDPLPLLKLLAARSGCFQVTVKRLHDVGLSGLNTIWIGLLGLVGDPHNTNSTLLMGAAAVSIIAQLWLCIEPGARRANRFGNPVSA